MTPQNPYLARHNRPGKYPGNSQSAAPQQSLPKPKGRPVWLTPALLVAAVLLLGGLYVFTSSDTETLVMSFTRDAAEVKAAPATKEVFSDQLILKLRGGDGLEIKFAETFRGQPIWKNEEINLTKWNRLQKLLATRPTRTHEVMSLIPKFEEAAQEWAKHHSQKLVYEVALDTSEGITAKDRALVFDRIGKLGIADRLKAGDSVEFYTFQFGEEDFLHYDTTVVSSPSGYSGIRAALTDLTTPKKESRSTSFSAAIFNAIGKNHGKKHRTFVIFSDGLQYGRGYDFIRNPPVPEQFEKIFAGLQKEVKCPDLSGVQVYWYFPKSEKYNSQIRAAREFWKAVFEKNGAEVVEMEY